MALSSTTLSRFNPALSLTPFLVHSLRFLPNSAMATKSSAPQMTAQMAMTTILISG
jgi:hypothetical protein